MNSSEGKTAFYDKFYDRIWRQFREARKDSLGSYFLKALTAFLRLKPVKLDDEATVKKFYRRNNRFELVPAHPTMEPIIADEVSIVGKVVGVFHNMG